ncbi:hypothetical protein [Paractinoplanes durhamensis]|uniref:Uncharacterized protein n=1 Tax=Paractinoplanes durhamensis TaxID=113563 RepID=A0ABQ3YV15_9ACTN|nr:hypothetical protein [Actinoplanes durhamensis]GIE01440.1 hypothetical protein Adu01nite_27900 [Actinoplanes durhamensis]
MATSSSDLLSPYERRHADSLHELQRSSALEGEFGNADDLGPDLADLRPFADYGEAWAGVRLPEQMSGCALRFTELGARWQTSEGILGEFYFRPFSDLVTDAGGAEPWPEATDFQTDFMSQLRVFDQTPRSGAGKLTYLRLQPGPGPLEIWYSDIADIADDPYPDGFIKMDITYCEYLDALLLTKGTYGWQYLYTDISLDRGDFVATVEFLDGMLQLFPTIFPQHDYSDLRERLEARR